MTASVSAAKPGSSLACSRSRTSPGSPSARCEDADEHRLEVGARREHAIESLAMHAGFRRAGHARGCRHEHVGKRSQTLPLERVHAGTAWRWAVSIRRSVQRRLTAAIVAVGLTPADVGKTLPS